jgi:hypothetical protein
MRDLSGRPLTNTSLDSPLFVDRSDEMRRLLASVDRRANVLVLAPPGYGKTSFLHQASRELGLGVHSPRFVDAAAARSVDDLLDLVTWRLSEVQRPVDGERRTAVPPPEPPTAVRLQDRIANLAASVPSHERIVLLVDEPPAGDVGHTLFGRLRDELWQLPFVWIVAIDTADRAALMRPPADAFFAVTIEVGPLSQGDSRELLSRRLGPTELSNLDQLVEFADGSPRRLLALARDIVINERSWFQIVDEETRRRHLLRELGDSATKLFEFLQDYGPASASDEDLLAEMDWTRARATQVLTSLEEAGLVAGTRQKGGRRKVYEPTDLSAAAV